MSADVDITTNKQENILAIPFSAVVMRTLDMDSLLQARAGKEEVPGSTVVSEVQAAEAEGDEETPARGHPQE